MARGRRSSGGGRGGSTVPRGGASTSMKAGKGASAGAGNASSLLAKVAAAGQGKGAGLIGKTAGGEVGTGRGRGGGTRGRGGTPGRRGRGRRPSGNKTKGGKNNSQSHSQTSLASAVIIPVVPPLYPQLTVKTSPLDAHLNSLVPTFLELTKYYKCNYSIPLPKTKYQSPFEVKRYSDRYNGPLSLDPLLVHIPDPKRLPTELMTKGIIRNTKPYVEFDIDLKFQYIAEKERQEKYDNIEEVDLVSDDDSPRKIKREDNPVAASAEDKPLDDIEDDEEELDEELDVGTDYMANYFDNGEDYLDEDEDSMDDSAVY